MRGKDTVIGFSGREACADSLSELLREGAVQLIHEAVEAELASVMEQHADRRLGDGKAVVVRNGYQPQRQVHTGMGPVTVRIPKVRARDGTPVAFRSARVPPYVRKTASLEAALPWLYLKGVSSGEMGEALGVLVGPRARGLSASTVARLKQVWAQEYARWRERRLDRDEWVYVWADGIYSGLRAEDARLCALVIIGVNARGEKHFLALEGGVRESTQSWREVLLDLKARGMNAPKLAIGDGAMGFWAALEEICPHSRQPRCWMHKSANVLNCMPRSIQPKVKQALHEIWQAETRAAAHRAFDGFIQRYEAKYPKATLSLHKDREALLAFYDFPARHWQSLRTTHPIESTFGTLRHRTKRAKGCLTRDGLLHMMFKLSECAQKNWRRQRGFDTLAKVITGVRFKDGIEVMADHQVAA